MVSSREFWNKRAEIYDDVVGEQYRQTNEDTVAHALNYLNPTDRVLEFACGTGVMTLPIAARVAQVRAIDIADEMVRRAAEKIEAQGVDNIELSRTDLFDPCLEEGSFDAVMAFNVLCYVDNFEEVLARIRSLLKPGGVFLSATDCLGEKLTRVGVQKFVRSRTGKMPYVAFFGRRGLEKRMEACGFTVVERANLYPAPPNLFLAAK